VEGTYVEAYPNIPCESNVLNKCVTSLAKAYYFDGKTKIPSVVIFG